MSRARILRGEIWWVSLDPTQGGEIKKTRPCLVISHDMLNELRKTVVVIPISSAAQPHPPVTVSVTWQGKPAVAIIDQIRAVARRRLKSRIENASVEDMRTVENGVTTVLQLP